MQDQIEQLRQESHSLTVQLAQLPPPSSEYNGGGSCELPAGLPPPNLLGETDAISARATVSALPLVLCLCVTLSSQAGSSSPVSSISGFSTAGSHQDEQNDERERTDTITTASADPFSAFTSDAFITPSEHCHMHTHTHTHSHTHYYSPTHSLLLTHLTTITP